MSENLPAIIPSLSRAFEEERETLRLAINDQELSSTRAVREAKRSLDRTGSLFVSQTEDMHLQKAGLWLLEMVKSGAGVLDHGAKADVVWREVPQSAKRIVAGSTLFYGTAGVFLAAGFVQGSKLTMMAAIALAALRFFDPKDWKRLLDKIPFVGRNKRKLLEAPSGQAFLADAHISVEAGRYIDSLADALRTADHILVRLAEPTEETDWRHDKRLISFVQGLLEAKSADDSGFAMKLVGSELETILRSDGIEIIDYSKKTADMFDVLPALDLDSKKPKQAAPALVSDGEVLRRGTVWVKGA